jgi:hypothetical protein
LVRPVGRTEGSRKQSAGATKRTEAVRHRAAESAQEDPPDARHSRTRRRSRRLREQKPLRDFLVDLKRDPPALLTVVTREQPRIAEICRRCEIGTRLEI